ncbi:hypothetical protein HED60_23195 [Planctomycetales bacterium ZRK34]|nr:hypothetical protein HED60_23195 [Planctomycetales bacterium ZRK34]
MPTLETNPTNTNARLNRQAIRFLFTHRMGRLMTEDPITGEAIVTPVRYVNDDRGAFVTHLPAGGDHARAIERGGRTMLSVSAPHRRLPEELIDEHGQPTPEAIWHVQAEVEVERITTPQALEKLLNRHVATLAQAPIPIGGSDLQRDLIGLRLHPVALTARLRESALAMA